MCLSCGACISQWILFILNFILSIIGLAIIGIGVYGTIELKKIEEIDLNIAESLPIALIVVGCIFTAIFFCGCCGAFCRNRCLLTTYSVIMIILATATVVFVVFVYKSVEPVKEAAQQWLMDNFKFSDDDQVFSIIESTVGCCGTTGPDSYNNTKIPVSCCPSTIQHIQDMISSTPQYSISVYNANTEIPSSTDSLLSCSASDAYQDGCVQLFSDFIGNIISIIGQSFIWVIVVEYLAAFLAIFLTCYAGRKQD